MEKKFLFLLTMLILTVSSNGNDWKAYMAFHDFTYNQCIGDKVYALANGSIFTYRAGDTKVHTFSKATGMSDCNIISMTYNEEEEAFLLIYDNYNMDVLGINDSITNMPQYKNSSLVDKGVNHVTMDGKYAYVATNSGVVMVDMHKREFSNVYKFGVAVTSCAKVDNWIVVTSRQGMYHGDTNSNLLDASNWQKLNTYSLDYLIAFNGNLYARVSDGIYKVSPETGGINRKYAGVFSFCSTMDDCMIFGNNDEVVRMDENGEFKSTACPNEFTSFSRNDSVFWTCQKTKGLQAFKFTGDRLLAASDAIIPNSPIRNLDYFLDFSPSEALLVGGGSLNYTAQYYPGTVMTYKDGIWNNFSEDSIATKTGTSYINVTCVVEDPKDPTHHFVGAAAGGVYEFRNGKFVNLYSCDNSPLTTILPDDRSPKTWVRTAGLVYDRSDNLWMLNNQVDTILRVWKADGSWKSFKFNTLAGYPTFDHIYLDSRGIAWITHRRTTSSHHAGILGFYYGGTLDDTSDDTWEFRYQFTNQDNTSYTFNQVYDIAEDRDGKLWIATNQGPFVLNNPTSFFDTNPVFSQVVVPRNDGTNYADYLLTGVPITCIAIDGGNRKWFGTSNNGVYLISADGLETIHHFTAENSPLLSNGIYDIAINDKTGEVLIGTDAGLIGYRSDATKPIEPIKDDNIKVYPNPVHPNFEGNLRVDGLSFNSDVKITTVSGQVVAQGQSVGGTFIWNLRDSRGKRVATGIYYVIASNEEGKEAAVAKFLVVK